MAFEIEHDWQANLATPRVRIGNRIKSRLLIVLCAIWVLTGLVGHQPWSNEASAISIVQSMLSMQAPALLAPIAVGKSQIEHPPIYYWIASLMAKAFSPLLSIHDAARLSSGFWMILTLLVMGMSGRELWGAGQGRQATLIFMSSLGLVVTAHQLIPAVSSLFGTAMAFYGFALSKRRPYRASILLGSGVGISFLSGGILMPLNLILTGFMLALCFRAWRTKSFAIVAMLALCISIGWSALWLWPAYLVVPGELTVWWQYSLQGFQYASHWQFIKTLVWYAWPALPLACWGAWRLRQQWLNKPRLQLILVFFLATLAGLGWFTNGSETFALPLLIPLSMLACGSVEMLKRGAAAALNWFGLMFFGLLGFLIWLGWFAHVTGWPAKLAARMVILSGMPESPFNITQCLIGVLLTVLWLLAINPKRSNRAAVTEWAVGITMTWSLLMTLWLPLIDSARSYQPVFTGIKQHLPERFACINSRNLPPAQQALMHYYTGIRVLPLEISPALACDLYLIRDQRNQAVLEPGSDWELIWQGKRPAERKENLRLYSLK